MENFSAPLTITAISENALLLTWPEKICPLQHQRIIDCEKQIKVRWAEHIIESLSAYNSLIIYYDFLSINTDNFINDLNVFFQEHNAQQMTVKAHTTASPLIEIPVYYSIESGWDLAVVAQRLNTTPEQIIKKHTATTYHAYALGFTPGFCYLASLDKTLQLPRKEKPRLKVPKGAVAIAEQQTAIYPNESPGGWHIIGQCPHDMYDIINTYGEQAFHARINVGMKVRFRAIHYAEFCALGGTLEPEIR